MISFLESTTSNKNISSSETLLNFLQTIFLIHSTHPDQNSEPYRITGNLSILYVCIKVIEFLFHNLQKLKK